MDASPKSVREHIARAKFNTQRGDILRAMRELAQSMGLLALGKIVGRERIEIGIFLEEAVRLLADQDMMKRLVPGGIKYAKGKEREVAAQLMRMADALEEAMRKRRMEERRKRLMELDEIILAGQDQLRARVPLEARRLFRRAMEQFGDEPGLPVDIGARLFMAGLAAESMEYFQKGMELNPGDPRPYTYLSQCYEALGDADKAEEMIRTTLRRFGPNEGLFVRLGKAALARRNWDEALNCAQGALAVNPLNDEAHRIGTEASVRVFGDPKGYLKTEAKDGAAAPARTQTPVSKEIKLDL